MTKIVAPRDAYGEILADLGQNKDIFVLNGDVASATKTIHFSKIYPERYLNTGIAEQNMIGMAAGLARSGFIPVVSTFACFAPGRVYDQIRQVVAYSNSNVKIISTHPGLAIGADGAIHQCLDDISLMRELPNMVVLAPSDQVETKKAVSRALKHKGPVYVRIGRKECPILFDENIEFRIGKGYTIKEGHDITLMAHGSMVGVVYEGAKALQKEGIEARVINMSSIKPIDVELIISAAKETAGIVTAEDHFLNGGLYSSVCEITSSQFPCKVKGVAVNDTFGESGSPQDLYEKYGLTKEKVVKKAKEILDH